MKHFDKDDQNQTKDKTITCHAAWHNNAVATVRSYFKSVSPIFKRSKRHITICNPSEAKTPVLAASPAQLHCPTRCPRYRAKNVKRCPNISHNRPRACRS